ncbi:MAG: phage/plasmid primase, P4 family, partial [Syntrophales bacterium LBB04]|nr:phage/plasmid primase, P4 family [Syntrophales bacterium LBB04]
MPTVPDVLAGLKGVRIVLYNLPNVIKADEILVVEGENDADNLNKLGFTATTNPKGGNYWEPSFNPFFKDKNVVIFPDNDDTGKKHAFFIANQLHNIARSIKILELPGLPETGDVSDFISKYPDKEAAYERLSIMIEECQPYQTTVNSESQNVIAPSNSVPTLKKVNSDMKFALTDLGNAERLVNRYGNVIRYCPQSKKWFIWNEKFWQRDDMQKIKSLAINTVRFIYQEITTKMDKIDADIISKHAKRSENIQRINAIISLAEPLPDISIPPSQLDSDTFLFNCQNGTVNLRNGELQPHSPDNFITKISPVVFDEKAECLLFLKFLNRIFNDNSNLISYIQRVLGYSLTGDTGEQCFFILYGTGANGKSTLIELFRFLMNDYACHTESSTFLIKKNQTINNDVARLQGSRFVSCVEFEHGKSLAESLIKQATGGDKLTGRFLFCEYFEFDPTFKLFIATNHKPNIQGIDEGIWRRIRLIPFDEFIPENERDPKLLDKLKKELPGIFNWLLQGCLDWQQKKGLGDPTEVSNSTKEYREEMDTLGDFIAECCITKK